MNVPFRSSTAAVPSQPAAFRWALSLAVLILCMAATTSAFAQQAAGAISGIVSDSTGSVIPNALVTARDVDRGTTWTTRTTSAGIYEFPQITVGNIEVRVEASGFTIERDKSFALTLNQVVHADFHLSIGKATDTVQVIDAPPLLQVDSTQLGTLIDSKTTEALPLATRDINQLTLLAPGVVSPNIFAFQSPQTTFGTGRPYVNGAREQDNNFSLDGMDTNQADNNEVAYVPGPDAVQEFNIITSNAPADFGNYIGGVIVETLKSGTNQYHGDLFEFIRNTDLNANSWQNNAIGAPRNPLHWNEFGGTIGGPIVKNKLFFFADYQSSLYSTPANTIPITAALAALRAGDFSADCTAGFTAGICNNPVQQLYDPGSSATVAGRTPFLNNQVPLRSAAASSLFASSLFPAPGASTYSQHNYTNSYQGDVKIDWQASPNDHLMGRYSQQYVINNTANSQPLIPSLTREYPLKNFVIDYARTLTPSLVNEFRIGAQIFPANDQEYTNPTGQNFPNTFGIPGVQSSILPALNIGSYSTVGSNNSVEIFHDTTYELEDSITLTHGKHSIHAGFEWFHYMINDLYPGNQGISGSFTFNGQFTGNTGTSNGDPAADFILGLPSDVQEGTPLHFNLRNSLFGAFVQDTWQIAPGFTVNYGLRYELTTARGDKNSQDDVNFNLITGEPEIGKNYNTYKGIDNFQPRLGFSWQPSFLHNTVVRGAYDISTFMEGTGLGNLAVANPPYQVARDENNAGLSEPLTTLDEGYASFQAAACTAQALALFSPACLSSTTVHLTNPKLQPAVDQQWNVVVQKQFGQKTVASVGYVGNKIDHMSDIFLYNQRVLGTGGAVTPPPYAPPLIQAGADVRYNDSSAISRYNALEFVVAQKGFHGLDLQGSYTFSKCLSNSLGYFGQYGDEEGTGQSQTNGGYFFFQNEYNPKADYGRCITDLASNFNGYAVYELPFGKGREFASGVNPIVNQVIGGWSVATDFTFHSGFAINVSGPDESGTGSFNSRPDCVAGVSQSGSKQFENVGGSLGIQFLNPAAVTVPAAGTFGTCGVGAFRGPDLKTADVNVIKAFPIHEKVNLQFMAQFINLTNTPIFGAPNSNCGPSCTGGVTTGPTGGNTGDGAFGFAQSQDPGRQIQFGLKLNY
jgi:hypothetical protein